jgi:hypothetical protein
MATLINGNGNPRIYAAQDADLIAALAGDITGIAQIGNKFAATAVDANTISVADGVIVTKEGRRIQLDAGSTDMFVIPTGTTGVTNYYIIGYKLTTQSDDSQIAETFVQLMSSSSETITEDTFREGATDVYVSLYRVQQNGVNLGTITGLLPELTNISELKSDLADKVENITPSINWVSGLTVYYYKTSLVGKQLCINAHISGLYMTQNQTVTIGTISGASSSLAVGTSGITIGGIKYLAILEGSNLKTFTPEVIAPEDRLYMNLSVVID